MVEIIKVSNLLGSPASGEGVHYKPTVKNLKSVSNLLGSPASGELKFTGEQPGKPKFPIYWVPQRVGRGYAPDQNCRGSLCVSNLLGSPASGEW